MAFLFFAPSILVPVLLIVLILLVVITIIAISIRNANQEQAARRRTEKMRRMSAAASTLNLRGEEMQKLEEEKEEVKPVKSTPKNKDSGDKTIYDDRKNLSTWQVHLSDTYKAMKKKNPKTTFQAAMKAAKKTYKKK